MIVYKYLTELRVSTLRDRLLRFTPTIDFNDTFECDPVLEKLSTPEQTRELVNTDYDRIVEDEFRKLGLSIDAIRSLGFGSFIDQMKSEMPELVEACGAELIPSVKSAITGKLNEMVGVFCVSKNWSSQLMWAHYANSHRGFCLGFDSDSEFFNRKRGPEDEFGWLRTVIYKKDRPQVNLSDTDSVEWFLTKSEVWQYEEEMRIFRPLCQADSTIIDKKSEMKLFQYPASALKEVIFGRNSSDETILAVCELLKDPAYAEVEVYHIQNSEKSFDLVRHAGLRNERGSEPN